MKIFYDRHNRRLIYLGQSASPDFWDNHWGKSKFKKSVESGRESRLIQQTLKEFIPDRTGLILDGGCGNGQIVYGMQARGYRSIGVDSASRTIATTKELFPELDVHVGDVRDLPFPDDHFIGYWSLGVIEHFPEGYSDILKEMKRVLVNGGYLFLSFPCMSPLRKLKARLGLYQEFAGNEADAFYQFALNPDAVVRDLKARGFEPIKRKPLSGLKGFKDEISISRPVLQKLYDYQGRSLLGLGFRYALDRLLAFVAGHTVFLVFRNLK
jgi:SAM-dependent methyltransferase